MQVPACVRVERGAQFSGDGSLVAAAGGRASNAFRLGLPRGSQGWMAAKTGIDPCQRSKHRASLSVDVGAGGGHVTTMQMAGPACGDGLGLALPFREASEPAGGGR